jgi:hypothetical protein
MSNANLEAVSGSLEVSSCLSTRLIKLHISTLTKSGTTSYIEISYDVDKAIGLRNLIDHAVYSIRTLKSTDK